jgi:hypothetical protein
LPPFYSQNGDEDAMEEDMPEQDLGGDKSKDAPV